MSDQANKLTGSEVPGCTCGEPTSLAHCPYNLAKWGELVNCTCCKQCRNKCLLEIGML